MVFFRLVSGFGTAQCSRLCAKRHESGRRDVAAAPKADEVIFEVGRVAGGDWAAGVAHVPPSSALQSGEARAAIVARLVGPHPLVDVAGQIEDAIAALAVGARAARHATVEPQQLGALDLRLFGVNAIEDRAHPLVVEVALLGLATPAGRKRRLLRTFASCDPLALTAHALALLGAAGFGVVEADHHRRLLTPTVRVLELVDAVVERDARRLAGAHAFLEMMADRDVVRRVVLFVEALPLQLRTKLGFDVLHTDRTRRVLGRRRCGLGNDLDRRRRGCCRHERRRSWRSWREHDTRRRWLRRTSQRRANEQAKRPAVTARREQGAAAYAADLAGQCPSR